MFTGIISNQGIFKGYRRGRQELAMEMPGPLRALDVGGSVSVNGACLSVTRREGNRYFFDLSQETLVKTNLGSLRNGEKVNLELPLTLQTYLGGHLVTGHIDGKGKVLLIAERPPG
ncbi:MAG: riboflavin synthase, partial [Acidobacteriota bacterium]